MEGEPPLKRVRRTDSAAMWDHDGGSSATAGRPPQTSDNKRQRRDGPAHGSGREESRNGVGHGSSKQDSNQARTSRSRSPREEKHRKRGDDKAPKRSRRDRKRSRSPLKDTDKDRVYRDRDSNRDRDRDQEPGNRDARRHDRERERGRERSQSRDRKHDHSRDVKGKLNHCASRSKLDFSTNTNKSTALPGRDTVHKRARSRSPVASSTNSAHAAPPPRAPRSQAQVGARKDEPRSHLTNGSSGPTQSDLGSVSMDTDEDGMDVILKKMMGFSSFKSTHNTKVPGNQIYGVRKEKKTEYRQYMNRVGGFNRPLSPGH